MEWQLITGRTGYVTIGNAIVVGYLLPSNHLVLIDSGVVESPRLKELLKVKGWQVCAVIHTHLHVDHIANNGLLAELYPVEFYASKEEVESFPLNIQKNEIYLKEDSTYLRYFKTAFSHPIHGVDTEHEKVCIEGAEFELIALAGHTNGHCAVVTPDGVCCLGDALVSGDVLQYSKLPYMEDFGESMTSLEKIKTLDFGCYVVAHASVEDGESIVKLVEENILKEETVCSKALNLLETPMPLERAVERLLEVLEIGDKGAWSSSFISYTARGRFVYLEQLGKIKIEADKTVHRV